ncbi:STARP antigen, putative [Schistosoma mansoni]|uniref:STARP antigen, putative n=1 Tax=Schistosoma mansoni TaxID=6183 RepID=UPI00022C82AB|nr:STARP antigen, putative [Schistosoma mansoni]|eukprot:XP_018644865.1 STARP antigen, putative [Schistosoma mansoni]
MIPYTESCGNYTRVPPIANIHSSYHIQQINSNGSSSTCASNENTICSRRGRRSNVPPEIREQTRRLKKQNMERRRRACISDKMNALHNLAMDLIGIDPNKCHKVEKADILNLCQSVFEGITNIAKDEPKFQERLRKLRYNLNEIPNSSSIASTTSSSSLSTSTNNSTSNLNENMNVNGKDNSLRKFTRNSHQHRSYHQSQQHSHSTNNISSFPTTGTTTTANTNTQMFSTSTISPPLPTIDQTIDEDDKENRIPRLLIKSNSSTGNYNTPYLNNVTVNSTCNSTPLQYNDKYNSLLSDCDSGFFSSGIQSVGFTPNANNVVGVGRTDISIDSVQCTDLCSVNVSNTDQRNCNVFMSCMGNMSSLAPSSLSCDGHLSAFSVPVARSGLAGMNKSIGLHPTSVGHGKVDNAFVVDSISCTQGLISSSTGVSSETISTKDPVMWRPYLD